METSEILKKAIENGIINLSTLGEQVEMNERKKYLDMHTYAVWQGKDGKWYTYLPDIEKGRRLVKRSCQEGIENAIIKYWKSDELNPSIDDIFKEWLEAKLKRGEIQKATYDRYKRQYEQCFSEFGKRKIKYIQRYDVKDFILNTIAEKELTTKGYSNFRTLIYGIFKRAIDKELIDFSISETVSDLEISQKLFRKKQRIDDELAFNDSEIKKIENDILNGDIDIIDLAILLLYKTGVRPGEISAIKKVDITGRILHINRTEIKYNDENGHQVTEVRDFPKTEAGIRDVVLPASADWILRKIRVLNPFGEYLFERDGNRIKTYMITRRLKKICKRNYIKPKSLNKIRKTYGTILLDSGIAESVITSQMGHTDIKTTKRYYYVDRHDLYEKIQEIDSVANL